MNHDIQDLPEIRLDPLRPSTFQEEFEFQIIDSQFQIKQKERFRVTVFEGVILISSKKGELFQLNSGRNFIVIDPSLRITPISDMKYYQNLVKITTCRACVIFSAPSPQDKSAFIDSIRKCRADVEENEEERKSFQEKKHQYLKTNIVRTEW